jgi:hypothetical protein
MKSKKQEKRVINIPKEQFDIIKKHCEDNSLDMVSWITKNSLNKICGSLENLYDYVELQQLYSPNLGNVPFRLHPYQKQILKYIHENDKIIFVKARQIGMTSLLAAYQSWGNSYGGYNSPNSDMNDNYLTLIKNFTNTKNKSDVFYYCADELNFCDSNKFKYFVDMTNELTSTNTFKYKIIVAGSIDKNNNLKWLIDNKDKYGFKVFKYSAKDCFPMWNQEKIQRMYQLNSNDVMNREMDCKFD